MKNRNSSNTQVAPSNGIENKEAQENTLNPIQDYRPFVISGRFSFFSKLKRIFGVAKELSS